MSVEELIALLKAELQDDILGEIKQTGNGLTITFEDGTQRTITVQ